jgi:hypothetical protein
MIAWRVSQEEYDRLHELAAEAGLSLSEFLRARTLSTRMRTPTAAYVDSVERQLEATQEAIEIAQRALGNAKRRT